MGGESDRWGFNGTGCVWFGGGGKGAGGARTGAPAAGRHHAPHVPASLLALFFNSASCFSSYIKLSELGQGGPSSRPHPGWDADRWGGRERPVMCQLPLCRMVS